jgi:hypothetical protein
LSIDDSVAFLQRMMVQWQAAQEPKTEGGRDSSIRQPCSQVKYWTPPAFDSIRVNVDGAFNPMSGAAAVGVIAGTTQATRISWIGVYYYLIAGTLKKRMPLLS